MRTGYAEILCWGAKRKRRLEVPGLSAHGAVDNLQLVFPEIGRTTDRPKKLSEQEASVAATNYAGPSRGECLEQTAAVAANNCAGPSRGEWLEQTAAVAATNCADPSRGKCLEQTAAVAANNYADRDAGKQHEQAAYNQDNSISRLI